MKLLLFQEIIFEGSTSHKKKKKQKNFWSANYHNKGKSTYILCSGEKAASEEEKKKVCSNFSENLLYFGNGVSSFRAYSEEKLQHFKQNFIRLRTKIWDSGTKK